MKKKTIIMLLGLGFCVEGIMAQGFTNFTVNEGLASNNVNCLFVEVDDDTVWFGTDKGINRYDGSSWQTFSMADSTGLLDDDIKAIHVSEDGIVWAGTDFGISSWDGISFTNYTELDGIGDDRIQAIDSYDETIVFGTKDGVSILDVTRNEWKSFDNEQGLPFGGVTCLELVDDDLVFLGLGLSGVSLFDFVDTVFVDFTKADGLLSNKIKGLFLAEEDETLWIASDLGMNLIFGDDNDEPVIESHPSVFDLPPPHTVNQLTDVVVDSRGIVWAGVYIDYLVNVGGISYYDGEVWTTLDMDDGLIGPVVNQLALDSENCVWVATTSGASRYCAGLSASLDISDQYSFSLFPNPSKETITITLQQSLGKASRVTLYDSNLSSLETKVVGKGAKQFMLSIDHLTSGFYFINIGGSFKKFIKH